MADALRLGAAGRCEPRGGGGGPPSGCPPGKEPFACIASPCFLNAGKCPGGTTCVDDYCGGCNYKCVGQGQGQGPVGRR
jgi:hypothetical protein